MLNHFVTQALPLLLALLGAFLGAALGAYLGAQTRLWNVAISLLLGLAVAFSVYLVFEGIAFDRRVRALAEVISREVDSASTIEYRRGGANQIVCDQAVLIGLESTGRHTQIGCWGN